MKKSKLVAFFLVSSLLLAGCELPKNLESIVKWRQTWYSGITPDEIQKFLGPIILLLVTIILLKGLVAIAREMGGGESFLEGSAAPAFVQLVAVASLYFLLQWANTVTDSALPPNITIDTVLKNLSLSFSIDPAKAITSVWALTFSVLMGVVVSLCLFTDFLIAFGVVIWSVFRNSSKALWFIVAVLVGRFTFFFLCS
jgi:hypothetical protein